MPCLEQQLQYKVNLIDVFCWSFFLVGFLVGTYLFNLHYHVQELDSRICQGHTMPYTNRRLRQMDNHIKFEIKINLFVWRSSCCIY